MQALENTDSFGSLRDDIVTLVARYDDCVRACEIAFIKKRKRKRNTRLWRSVTPWKQEMLDTLVQSNGYRDSQKRRELLLMPWQRLKDSHASSMRQRHQQTQAELRGDNMISYLLSATPMATPIWSNKPSLMNDLINYSDLHKGFSYKRCTGSCIENMFK